MQYGQLKMVLRS